MPRQSLRHLLPRPRQPLHARKSRPRPRLLSRSLQWNVGHLSWARSHAENSRPPKTRWRLVIDDSAIIALMRMFPAVSRGAGGLAIGQTRNTPITDRDLDPLSRQGRPPGEHGNNARLQIGTWHSAQWRSLRYEQDRSSRSIEFLPGIIIQGHEWRFVASVLDVSGKCQLLEAVALGNTGSILGVYSLMASLQRLRRWIKEEYWQAFVSDILM